MTVELRLATLSDASFLRELRNDPLVRKQSRGQETIGLDEHEAWLTSRLADSEGCRLYIACVDGERVGQARLDRLQDRRGEISLALVAAARGSGLGSALIEEASRRGATELGLGEVVAVVRKENTASLRAFERAGYVLDDRSVEDRAGLVRLVWAAAPSP